MDYLTSTTLLEVKENTKTINYGCFRIHIGMELETTISSFRFQKPSLCKEIERLLKGYDPDFRRVS